MKDSSIELIRTVLASDETVTPEQADNVLKACRQRTVKRHLINAKEVMDTLQISRPTLRAYVRNGLLTQINFSPRRVRFDQTEVQQLANTGIVPEA